MTGLKNSIENFKKQPCRRKMNDSDDRIFEIIQSVEEKVKKKKKMNKIHIYIHTCVSTHTHIIGKMDIQINKVQTG